MISEAAVGNANVKALVFLAQRTMAARATSKTVEINSSHAVMVSHPDAVTALIVTAATR